MDTIETTVVRTWLDRRPQPYAFQLALLISCFVVLGASLEFLNLFDVSEWMAASQRSVYTDGQVWRAWTSLLVHADTRHLFSNFVLFLPLLWLLINHFGPFWLPLLGFVCGGLVNLIVLTGMREDVRLVGLSGVVYWLAGTWMTLFFLIDRRKTLRRRFSLVAILIALILLPDKFEARISYMSHLLGFIFGLMVGLSYFVIYRQQFREAEVIEVTYNQDPPG